MDHSAPQKRLLDHLDELITEGKRVATLQRSSSIGAYIQGEDQIPLHAWQVQVKNIVAQIFGTDSQHFRHLEELTKGSVSRAHQVRKIVGVLEGCKRDIQGGFLHSQRILLAGELFDDVLEQAEHLVEAGHKDPAAVLARVVLEDALRRIASEEGLDPSGKASNVNDEIKKAGRYAQPQWRLIQAWLDIGNAAAHGEFDAYESTDVTRMIDDVRRFIASELTPRV